MSGLSKNIEEMLSRLAENARSEQDFVQTLSESLRRVDEQLLREVRNISMQHELRREAILGELRDLATRLCALPVRDPNVPAIDQQMMHQGHGEIEHSVQASGADWRQATQNIGDEFDFSFNKPRH